MKKSPLAQLQEEFKDKAGLVAAVKKLAKDDLFSDRVNEDKGLDHVSNKKLLRLHRVLTDVQTKFGGRAALIDAVMQLEKRKDDGYRTHLQRFPTPRLWDMYRSSERRNRPPTPAGEGAPKKKPRAKAAPKAAPAKAPAKKATKGRKSAK